jgi:hypothetical protein
MKNLSIDEIFIIILDLFFSVSKDRNFNLPVLAPFLNTWLLKTPYNKTKT